MRLAGILLPASSSLRPMVLCSDAFDYVSDIMVENMLTCFSAQSAAGTNPADPLSPLPCAQPLTTLGLEPRGGRFCAALLRSPELASMKFNTRGRMLLRQLRPAKIP